MDSDIIVAFFALLGTLGGSFLGILASNKLTTYRIEQLEKKVDKHNNVIERVYKLEKADAVHMEEFKELKEQMNKLAQNMR